MITTLETLKQEAADISKKVEETDKVITEIETVSQQYKPLSQACSNMYFTMDTLNQIHFLYQYSLKFFLDIFSSALLSNEKLKTVSDHTQRLNIITQDLFLVGLRALSVTLPKDSPPFSSKNGRGMISFRCIRSPGLLRNTEMEIEDRERTLIITFGCPRSCATPHKASFETAA